MHIINLAIKCKEATGDGTKIVCLNKDYRVRVETEDCGTFTNAPVKKLIVRHHKEYYEVDIGLATENGESYLQAVLPPLENTDYVDLGVCGREHDDPKEAPIYTSTSARFVCLKSVLSGTEILKTDPILSPFTATENGTYRASDVGADGFYEVAVQVSVKTEESRAVDLMLLSGDQVVYPSKSARTMSDVVIHKPSTLTPDNIKKGVTIAGVVGSYEEEIYSGTPTVEDMTPDDAIIV